MLLFFLFALVPSVSPVAAGLEERLVAGPLSSARVLDGAIHRHEQGRELVQKIFAWLINDFPCIIRPESISVYTANPLQTETHSYPRVP